VSAGVALSAAICLKLTPALFVPYWLAQRNWRLAGAAAVSTIVLAVAVPAAALGPARSWQLTEAWVRHVVGPAAGGGQWYPQHSNQSLAGVASRYFLTGRDGDYMHAPDDVADDRHGWITLVALQPGTVRWIVRAGQLAVLAMLAWAIGWRRLGRDDGRRMLHYGLITLGMMLLNQRAWDHHAAVVLVAALAVWQAIAYGRVGRGMRAVSLGMALLAGVGVWLTRSDVVTSIARLGGAADAAGAWADRVEAYGPTFYYFVLLLVAGAILAARLRRLEEPYAAERQKLLA
jgi:hypothetical protein